MVTAASAVSRKETLWISKSTHLIKKLERSVEPPEGGVTVPKLTDAEIDEAIKAMGQTVSEESRNKMRTMMSYGENMLKTAKPKGSIAETHVAMTSPELNEADFHFAIPDGAVLKESLFSTLLDGGSTPGRGP